MDFDLSQEQIAIRDGIDRLVRERYDFQARTRHRAEPLGWSVAFWQDLADLGLLGLPFATGDGGLGGGPIDTMLVMEAFGRALVVEPYLSTVVTAGGLLRDAGTPAQKMEWIPEIIAGRRHLSLAQGERNSRYATSFVETRARRQGTGWNLAGEKRLVLNGHGTDAFVVVARTAGERSEADGIGLFLVPASAHGLSVRAYETQDGMRAADILLDDVALGADAALGDPEGGHPLLCRIVDETIAALCAEALGVMKRLHGLTMEHLKTRRQFGAPIGSFQVLQHRAADMYIHLEQARSMTLLAGMSANNADERARRTAISAAKVQIGRSGRFIGQQAVQLHGGIGMAMDYEVSHGFKRLTMIDLAYGDADHHLERLAEQDGLAAL